MKHKLTDKKRDRWPFVKLCKGNNNNKNIILILRWDGSRPKRSDQVAGAQCMEKCDTAFQDWGECDPMEILIASPDLF